MVKKPDEVALSSVLHFHGAAVISKAKHDFKLTIEFARYAEARFLGVVPYPRPGQTFQTPQVDNIEAMPSNLAALRHAKCPD